VLLKQYLWCIFVLQTLEHEEAMHEFADLLIDLAGTPTPNPLLLDTKQKNAC